MDKFWWRAAWGLCLVHLSLAGQQIDLNVTCRYAGVFHVEKNGRYSISRTEAADLCEAFNATLPTMEQMERARQSGFETCRYGFIQGHVVIPRIVPNSICAANNTGVYILTSNTSQYDTYCFNASAPADGEDCASITDLPNSFDGQVSITIVNRDGTRYTKRGEYRTNPNDINPSSAPEEDMSSGSSSERSTSAGYIFHTHLPTADPSDEQDGSWVSNNPKDNPATMTSTVYPNSHTAPQEQNSWIWSWLGNSQPKTQDRTTTATTALMGSSDTTPKTTTKKQETQDWFSWWFQPSEPKNHLHPTTKMAGTDSNIISAGWAPTEENEDERDKHPSYSGSGIDDDEDFISSTISTTPPVLMHPGENMDWTLWAPGLKDWEKLPQPTTRMNDVDKTGSSTYGESWTQEPHSSLSHHEHQEEEETQHSTSATTSAHENHPNQRMTTQNQEDSSWTDFLDPISHPMGQGHSTQGNMDVDTSVSPTLQPPADQNTVLLEDLDRTGSFSITTQQSHVQSFSTSHGGWEEDNDQLMTSASSNRNDDTGEGNGGNQPEDSTTMESYTSHSSDTGEHKTLIPVTPFNTGLPRDNEVTVIGDSNFNVDRSFPGDNDSASDSRGGSHTTQGSESAGHAGSNRDGGAHTTSGPMRKSQIPEWLIILASLLALALILAVCIAVNSRRRCGQKKKLVINNGNGAVDARKPNGLNGEASKSQEMVHLVNKEPSETHDQFMTADETRNLQNVDMKIGV